MEKNRIRIFWISSFIFSVFLIISSCQKTLDGTTNPNYPTSSKVELLLPNIQVTLAEKLAGRYVPFILTMWDQYWTSGPGISISQFESFQVYGADVSRTWDDWYSRTLQDIAEVEKLGEPKYTGISQLLKAYTFQYIVDLYGDAPYTEANKGESGILYPKYDKADYIYSQLIPLIDKAIKNIDSVSSDPTKPFKVPGTDDLIYGGGAAGLAKWKKFANSLRLKILMRQSKANPAKLTEALALINSGVSFITTNTDNCLLSYPGTAGNRNPMYQWFAGRPTVGIYMVGSKTSTDYLTTTNDPRISKFYIANTSGSFRGMGQGEVNEPQNLNSPKQAYARPSSTVLNTNTPVVLLASWETQFFIAEAKLLSGVVGDSLAYAKAVENSCQYLGVTSTTTINNFLNGGGAYIGSTVDKFKMIGRQKWVAMNSIQFVESFCEIRRFDTNASPIFRGVGGLFSSPPGNVLGLGTFPSLMPLPNSETSSNPNAPAQHLATDRVFWDN